MGFGRKEKTGWEQKFLKWIQKDVLDFVKPDNNKFVL